MTAVRDYNQAAEHKVVVDGAKTAIVFPCKGATMVEHIVHIDGVTGSSPVATTTNPRFHESRIF